MTAAILGLVNATLRPIFRPLTLSITAATIEPFLFVVNGVTLWLAAWVAGNVFEAAFVIDGLLPAILGSIIASLVSTKPIFVLVDDDMSPGALARSNLWAPWDRRRVGVARG